jgi:hypothetical protein
MSDKPITLEFLSRQQTKLLEEMASFRDDMTVLTAITMRLEGSVTALITEVRAMHSRHARLERRVEKLETNTGVENDVVT